MIGLLPVCTEIEKPVVKVAGIVEKLNVAPPFIAVGVIDAELDDDTTKSDATPVVAPVAPETPITQEIGAPKR